jgi:hypothetical protein
VTGHGTTAQDSARRSCSAPESAPDRADVIASDGADAASIATLRLP